MIYLDASAALAQLLSQSRRPPASLWTQELVSSRLLTYEIWNRLHIYRVGEKELNAGRELLESVTLFDLAELILARALDPFPSPVRTLDGLHLATIEFLRGGGHKVRLASYDARMLAAARQLGIPLFPLDA